MGLNTCLVVTLGLDHPSAEDFGLTPGCLECLVEDGTDTVLILVKSGSIWKPCYCDRVCRDALKEVLKQFLKALDEGNKHGFSKAIGSTHNREVQLCVEYTNWANPHDEGARFTLGVQGEVDSEVSVETNNLTGLLYLLSRL